jgi:Uncharacterized protein conserved in bacteria
MPQCACMLMRRRTTFSPCRTYRYTLWRRWAEGTGYAMFVCLNPSTADETEDDPTLRRCMAYAKRWGFGAVCMTNLFAYRATRPADMCLEDEPIGPDNNRYLRAMAKRAGVVVAAWGNNGTYRGRDQQVRRLLHDLYYLRLTIKGQPAHPLYLPAELTPTRLPEA